MRACTFMYSTMKVKGYTTFSNLFLGQSNGILRTHILQSLLQVLDLDIGLKSDSLLSCKDLDMHKRLAGMPVPVACNRSPLEHVAESSAASMRCIAYLSSERGPPAKEILLSCDARACLSMLMDHDSACKSICPVNVHSCS